MVTRKPFGGGGHFFIRGCVMIFLSSPGTHPASCGTGTVSPSPDVDGPASETDHLPTCIAEMKNAYSYTSTPQLRLHGVMLN
jgi:hypothetical protein